MNSGLVRQVNYDYPESGVIAEAIRELDKGGILAVPTETRYGLIVRADRDDALKKLYAVKNRSLSMPTALFVRDVDAAGEIGEVNGAARALAEEFLPGPLTLVLKALTDWKEPRVIDGRLGIRISSAPVVREMLAEVGYPLSATSANISGQPEPTGIEDVTNSFGDQVDLYLDAGRIEMPVSTVVDCTGDAPRVLRQGAISVSAVEEAVRKADL